MITVKELIELEWDRGENIFDILGFDQETENQLIETIQKSELYPKIVEELGFEIENIYDLSEISSLIEGTGDIDMDTENSEPYYSIIVDVLNKNNYEI